MAEYIRAPAGCPEVACLFRFTPGTNYRAHGIKLRDGGLIFCWSIIRKNDENKQTDRERRTDRQRIQLEGTLIPCRLSG